MQKPITLTLAHSPDPDDVFMWWPITGKIDPAPVLNASASAQRARSASEGGRANAGDTPLAKPSFANGDGVRVPVLSDPVLDTGRFRFISVPADIDVLNRCAIESPDADAFDITAISINTYSRVKGRYALTSFGSSMGYGYGPKVVVRNTSSSRGTGVSPVHPGSASNTAALSDADRALLTSPATTIAIPGTRTTAFLLLSMLLGKENFRFVEMPFDEILPAVAERRVDAGLLIHQSQLTFAELGLRVAIDVGAWWLARTELPLPLGGNAVRRDLDQRFGPGATQEVVDLLFASIQYALAHREESLVYSMGFAPELNRQQAERYIEMYVSDLTIDAGSRGGGRGGDPSAARRGPRRGALARPRPGRSAPAPITCSAVGRTTVTVRTKAGDNRVNTGNPGLKRLGQRVRFDPNSGGVRRE